MKNCQNSGQKPPNSGFWITLTLKCFKKRHKKACIMLVSRPILNIGILIWDRISWWAYLFITLTSCRLLSTSQLMKSTFLSNFCSWCFNFRTILPTKSVINYNSNFLQRIASENFICYLVSSQPSFFRKTHEKQKQTKKRPCGVHCDCKANKMRSLLSTKPLHLSCQ